jgi:hypothetical protein
MLKFVLFVFAVLLVCVLAGMASASIKHALSKPRAKQVRLPVRAAAPGAEQTTAPAQEIATSEVVPALVARATGPMALAFSGPSLTELLAREHVNT